MRSIAAISIVSALIATGTVAGVVHAADLGPIDYLPPPTVEPNAQFEFGTGWYLRGDASFGAEDHPVLNPNGFTSTKQDWNYVLGGGIGYKFNSFLRVDVTGDWFEPRDYSQAVGIGGGVTGTNTATLQHYDALANLYIDLGNWYGITPYVGGGVGVSIFDPSEKLVVNTTGVADNTGDRTTLAWAAMAGVSYQFDPNFVVDLGYRHLDLGRFNTTLVGYAIDHHYTEDQVRIGVRYMLN